LEDIVIGAEEDFFCLRPFKTIKVASDDTVEREGVYPIDEGLDLVFG